MPITGTPVTSTPAAEGCDAQAVKSPAVTQLYGISLPTKRRAVYVNQGGVNSVNLQILDGTGNPIDLTTCADEEDLAEIRIREVISTRSADLYTVTGSVTDVAQGIISFDVPTGVTDDPGVYNAEIGVHNADGDLIFTNKFFIWVDRGLFGDPQYPNAGPPSLDEVRLFIRDNAPEENRLLDDFEFDLAEICITAELGVRYWNESQPPIGVCFKTTSYPVRHKWLQFIAGQLFMTAAHRFRRNHLPY